jgi:hypothetical protein
MQGDGNTGESPFVIALQQNGREMGEVILGFDCEVVYEPMSWKRGQVNKSSPRRGRSLASLLTLFVRSMLISRTI